jgi:hypothetical protein
LPDAIWSTNSFGGGRSLNQSVLPVARSIHRIEDPKEMPVVRIKGKD